MRCSSYLFLLICIASMTADGQAMGHLNVDTSLYAVLPFNKRVNLAMGIKFDHPKPTALSSAEIDDMETLIDSAYRSYNSNYPHWQLKTPLSVYRRQYVAIINGKGQKEVWVNFFCTAFEDWRHEVEIVEDGGGCFFQLRINLSLKKIYDLSPNGLT